jgi:site-specific DNA recombinase
VNEQKVTGYFRVSQARDDMNAPEIYRSEIERYCRYRQLTLGEIFSDIDFSGYNNSEKRPTLRELVRRRHEFSAVIVPKLSRFGRSLKRLTQLFDTFERDGISLVFPDLGMDTSTSQGRLLRNIMSAFAEYESDVRGDYQRANIRYATQQGRPYGGPAPYGYEPVNKTYRPHPEHAEVVRFIFRRYADGASQFRIACELAAKGTPTSGGKPTWQANKIGRLLDNPAYASLMPLDGELVAGNWEPLVEPGLWHRSAQRRGQTRAKWSRPRAAKRLLAGLIYCGDCGRKAYYTARGGGLPGRYRCRHSDTAVQCRAGGINAPRADAYVANAFLPVRAGSVR